MPLPGEAPPYSWRMWRLTYECSCGKSENQMTLRQGEKQRPLVRPCDIGSDQGVFSTPEGRKRLPWVLYFLLIGRRYLKYRAGS